MKGQIPSFSWQAETKIDKITSLRKRVATVEGDAAGGEVSGGGVVGVGAARPEAGMGAALTNKWDPP
jgi:hypothetical protein